MKAIYMQSPITRETQPQLENSHQYMKLQEQDWFNLIELFIKRIPWEPPKQSSLFQKPIECSPQTDSKALLMKTTFLEAVSLSSFSVFLSVLCLGLCLLNLFSKY